MKKAVVYTAIFNNYDWLKEPYLPSEDIDYVYFKVLILNELFFGCFDFS